MSEPPDCLSGLNVPPAILAPKRVSTSALPPPTAGLVWQRAHDVSLKTGPSPDSGVSSSSKSSFPAANRSWSA